MLLGGTLLAIAGPLLACWPGRSGRPAGPGVAAVMLAVLFAVPAIQLTAGEPFVDGTIFALLLAAVLFAERLAPRDVPVAVPALIAAALIGLALAPRLDAQRPWVDYESIAQSLGERGTTAFTWDHQYGPLDWPRDGREVLRIRSANSAYWKATTLVDFDGLRWREIRPQGIEDDPSAEGPNPRWIQQLRVSVRNLRTNQFVAAGTTLGIDRSPRTVDHGAPGSFVTGTDQPLRRGHAYLARIYQPRPEPAQLDGAGAEYPTSLWPFLSMQLPERVGGPVAVDPATGAPDTEAPDAFVVFAPFGDPRDALAYQGRGVGRRLGTDWVRASAYARSYRLAQRLADASTTPYDFVRRVQQYLQRGFTYTETPAQRPVPLDGFLFRDRAGYCQQFSGAMALLLRMGGVPARVATGFTPGTFDQSRREYVVRDLDAHSWVEAYFPGYGWMTFDPTPAIAPPRAQAAGIDASAEPAPAEDDGPGAAPERGSDPAGIDVGAAAEEGGVPDVLIGLGIALAALLAGGLVLYLVGHRRHVRMSADDRVRELEQALRRSGRVSAQGLTLRALEHRLRSAPAAAAYVASLREGRYGFGGTSPTRRQRAALRRALAAGLGLRGRARALWALPPW
jgi:transglutaminase-like putative cysteine protease